MLSKEETPVLAGVIPAFEIFLSKWDKLAIAKPRLKPWIDEGLKWATKYYRRLDLSDAYVVGMCKFCFTHDRSITLNTWIVINPSVRFSWIEKNWDEKYKKHAVTTIKTLVSIATLIWIHATVQPLQMRRYRFDDDDNTISATLPIAVTPAPDFLQRMKEFDDEQAEGDASITEETIDEEYSNYVNGVPKRNVLDPLKFWEVSILLYL